MSNPNSLEEIMASSKNAMSPPPGISCNPEKHLLEGALGGAMIGFMTGFFKLDRMSTPISPFPAGSSSNVHEGTQFLVRCSAVSWRVTKRMFVGSILFPFIVCQLQGDRKTPGIVKCAIAGGLTGAIFGLRGGPLGVIKGTGTFAVFAALTEAARIFKGTD